MNIQEAKYEIIRTLRAYHKKDASGKPCFPVVRQRPILLMGPPGVGKTAIVQQAARECGVGLVSYTITHHTRQSAVGLPRICEKNYDGQRVSTTEYTMSEIIASVYDCMERSGKREGILFIDEINCVSETLAPTMLQFLQNKMFGTHRIPEGWMIVAAGNPPGYNKSVREFDIVTLDRVRRIDIEPDLESWLRYAADRNIHGAICSFLQLKHHDFYRTERRDGEIRFVTARGWEDLSVLLTAYEEMEEEVAQEVIGQYIQHEETAEDFYSYYRLFCRYGENYGIRSILSGPLKQEDYIRKTAMIAHASFEEKFTVTGAIVSVLAEKALEYSDKEAYTDRLYEILREWVRRLQRSDMMAEGEQGEKKHDPTGFEQLEKEHWAAAVRKKELGLIDEEEWYLETAVHQTLQTWSNDLKAEHALDRQKKTDQIREWFSEEKGELKRCSQELGEMLVNAFRWIEKWEEKEQAVLLLLSDLIRNDHILNYISRFGCDLFFCYYKQYMMPHEASELQEACKKIVKKMS